MSISEKSNINLMWNEILDLTKNIPNDSELDPNDPVFGSLLLKIDQSNTEWTSESLILNSHLMNVCEMLPECEILGDLQEQLTNLRRIVLFTSESVKQRDVLLDHFVGILQDLLPQVTGIPNDQIMDCLVVIILAMLKLSISISTVASLNGMLKKMLSQVLNVSVVDRVSEIPEKLISLLERDPNNVPINLIMKYSPDLLHYLHSLIESRTGPVVWIPRNLLLFILNIIRSLPNFQDSQEDLESHLTKILDPVKGITTNTTLKLVCVLPEDLKSLLVFMNILPLSLGLWNISRIKWPTKVFKDLMSQLKRACEMFPNSKLVVNLHSQLINLERTLLLDPESGMHKDNLIRTLYNILSQVKKISHVKEIQKYHIMDNFSATVKTLLVLSLVIPQLFPIKGLFEDILLQMMDIVNIEYDKEMPENMLLQIEREHEIIIHLPINEIVDHLSELKWYLQSKMISKRDSGVLVPRNLLLLCEKILNIVSNCHVCRDFQTHIKNILDPVTCRGHNDPVQGLVNVSSEDFAPLLVVLDHLTGIPKNLIQKFEEESINNLTAECGRKIPNYLLSLLANISWMKWKLKCLVTQLEEVYKEVPKRDFQFNLQSRLMNVSNMLPDLASQLMSTSDMDPSIKVPNEEILEHLVELLEDMTSEVTGFYVEGQTPIKIFNKNNLKTIILQCEHNSQTTKTREHLIRICNGLMSISVTIPNMSHICGKLTHLLKICRMEHDTAFSYITQPENTFETENGISGPKAYIRLFIIRLWDEWDTLIDYELISDLKSKVKNIFGKGAGIQEEINELVGILAYLNSNIMENNDMDEMFKFRILEPLSFTIESLLGFVSNDLCGLHMDMTSIRAILSDMLTQIENKLFYETKLVCKMTQRLELLVKKNPGNVPIDTIKQHFSEIRWYLAWQVISSQGNEILLPKSLLLLLLKSAEMWNDFGQNKFLQTQVMKILKSPCATTNEPAQNVFKVLPQDVELLLVGSEFVSINWPINVLVLKDSQVILEIIKDSILWYKKLKSKVDPFQKNVNYCLIDSKTKDLLRQLIDQCKLFPRSELIKKQQSQLTHLAKLLPDEFVPDSVITSLNDPKQRQNVAVILNCLDNLLPCMLSQVMGTDTQWVIPKVAILADLKQILEKLLSTNIKVYEDSIVNDELNNMLSHVGKVLKMESASEKLKVLVLELISVCEMLSKNELLTHLLSKLTKIYWMDSATGLSNDVIMDNIVSILHNLVSQVKEKKNSKDWILKNMMVDRLIMVIKGFQATFLNKCEPPLQHEELKIMLSILLNLYRVEWTHEKLLIFLSQIINVCDMLPENDLLRDLKSQLIRISKFDPECGIPREVILDHLVGILQDIISQLDHIKINSFDRTPKWQIMDHLLRIVKALHSLSMNLSEIFPVNRMVEDLLKHLIQSQLMDSSQLQADNEYLDLRLRIMSIFQVNPLKVPIDVILDALLRLFKHIVSLQWTSKMSLKNRIPMDLMVDYILKMRNDMMSVLLKVSPFGWILQNVQSQDTNKDSVTEITEKLQMFVNMTPEHLVCNLASDNINEIESLTETCLKQFRINPSSILNVRLQEVLLLKWNVMLFRYRGPDKTSCMHKYLGPRLNMYPVSELQEELVSDSISGILDDLLALLIYNFFPPSHLQPEKIGSEHSMVDYIFTRENYKELWTGSNLDYLWLPTIGKAPEAKDSPFTIRYTDFDVMYNLGWFSDTYDTMSLEIDKASPVFCRIKHGNCGNNILEEQSLPKLFDGQYLNSAISNVHFKLHYEKLLVPNHEEFTGSNSTIQNDYESVPFVFFEKIESDRQNTYISADRVFCIPVRWDGEYKQDFLHRLNPNKWPMNSVANLENLLNEHVYAVPKPDLNSEDGDLRWRLSFSVIEVELARSLTDLQRRCYKLLKALVKYDVNEGLQEENQFPSYYLKTAMFWFCEATCEESWNVENLGKLWLKLLDSLIASLEKKELQMYFIPGHNLLGDKVPGSHFWITRLKEIRKNPLESFQRFWSKHGVLIHAEIEEYGADYGPVLKGLCKILRPSFIAFSKKGTSFQHQESKTEVQMCKLYLNFIIGKFLLSTYSLANFLTFVTLFLKTKEFKFLSDSESKEHLIWKFYKELISLDSECNKNKRKCFRLQCPSQIYMYLAELTHHMVLKYGDQVPNKVLYSKQTAEKFHLIACSFQSEQEKITLENIRYANYLHTEKEFEDVVKLLHVGNNNFTQRLKYPISRVTSTVYDACLKLHLAFEHDNIISVRGFIPYHLLTSSYIQAGVLAEVHIPADFMLFCSFGVKTTHWVLLGLQYILCGRLVEALQTFNDLEYDKLALEMLQSGAFKYAAMLFISSRIFLKLH